MSNFESVKKFMQTFGQEVKTKPNFPEEQVVNVDEVFVRSGHANITDLQIKEINYLIA